MDLKKTSQEDINTEEAVSAQTDINTADSVDNNELKTDDSATEQSTEVVEEQTPEWFMKDKYKSVEEQARSAFELQKKMGKYWGSPKDNYEVEGIEGIDKDDPLVKEILPALKEMGISQDGFKHLVNQYMDANKKMMKELEEGLKKELTQNDAHTYQAIDKWMGENLTKDEQELIKNNWLMSAADFKLFNHLRLMAAPNTSVPSSGTNNFVRFESSKEVENDKIKYRKELKEGVRVADKNYENDLAARFRDARTREIRNGK